MADIHISSGTLTFLAVRAQSLYNVSARARYEQLLRDRIAANGGYIGKTVGGAFCAFFPEPARAVTAALSIQRALNPEAWTLTVPVSPRMALHTGTTEHRIPNTRNCVAHPKGANSGSYSP
jgi:class 3 adenylate cyclase